MRSVINNSKPIFIDSDCFLDVDDYGALTCAMAYQKLGYCNILGININIGADKTPGAVDSMRKYLGLPQIPISSHSRIYDWPVPSDWFQYNVYANYPHDVGLATTCPFPVTNIRTVLAARQSADVIFVMQGPATDVYDFLQSTADGISSLTGIQLANAKVKQLIWVGGNYPSGTDPYNFGAELTKTAYIINNWPTPIIFIDGGDILGQNIRTPSDLSSMRTDSPCKSAYVQAGVTQGFKHGSWDLLAEMIACEGLNDWNTVQGTNVFNGATGENIFTPGAGNHYYVTNKYSYSYYADHLSTLMNANPTSWNLSNLKLPGSRGFSNPTRPASASRPSSVTRGSS